MKNSINVFLLSGFMVYLMAFSACDVIDGVLSDESSDNSSVTLKIFAYDESDNFVRIVNEFEAENEKIKIDVILKNTEDEYVDLVAEKIRNQDFPDIAYMRYDLRWGNPWEEAGQYYNHNDILNEGNYNISLIPYMGDNGERWYIPMGTRNMSSVLFVNTALLQTLGLSIPTSYLDIKNMVTTAQTAGKEVITFNGSDGWAWGSCIFSTCLARTSEEEDWVRGVLNEENSFSDSAFENALNIIKTMVDDGVFNTSVLTRSYSQNTEKFNNGEALFLIQGQWQVNNIDSSISDDVELMPIFLPVDPADSTFDHSVSSVPDFGYGLTFKGASIEKNKIAAIKFLNFFNSEKEVLKRWNDDSIIAPVISNVITPATLSHLQTERMELAHSSQQTDILDAFISGDTNTSINNGCMSIASGNKTPAQVAAEVQAAWISE